MDHFHERFGELHAEDVPLTAIAEAVGTPVYVYAEATIVRHFRVFRQALEAAGIDRPLVAYAVKANPNLSVLAALAREGAGADVVSEGELHRALAAGVPPGRILFSGVGKTQAEMAAALQAGILQINVESEEELAELSQVATALGRRAPVALRVNPDVDARTNPKIATGRGEAKFGIPRDRILAAWAQAEALPSLAPTGLAVHVGSQLTDLAPFAAAIRVMGELLAALRSAGHAVRRVDLGGGLGIPYDPSLPAPPTPADYARLVAQATAGWGVELAFEPGRLVVGNAGVLLSRVVRVKRGATRTFVVLDAAMNDLIRPTLYGVFHHIRAVRPRPGVVNATFVGPVCETGDTFAEDRATTPLEPGDLVALMTAGAYGATMASTYNSRPLVPEVLVRGDRWALVRPRLTPAELAAHERLAPWLAEAP
ncbi:MAG: diaminopimelate decarboxylase [Sphingomonadaceae bacterium]|uniref:diaminopimelate decarboxylase n=1 Tax=Thermaurantiacus sp. TaxID=2820283 RepID=UPI00298ED7E8|nr:diaminopimelate decarboxylase [Thermaurantiacus sp.]MCS6986967.1 diaminopimelate decarboxylase [Sphingomonadaceae bacterium]MDW8415433.1 diaminopimelate decarboxylase [Thermaurantiacus sp.]